MIIPEVMMGVIPSSINVPRFDAKMRRIHMSGSAQSEIGSALEPTQARDTSGQAKFHSITRVNRDECDAYLTNQTIRFHRVEFESKRGR